jgi:hypothetical protein
MAWYQTSDPVERIVAWVAPIAVISFAVGYFSPIFLSTSNLGPLLGIFVTGPLGVLVGALVGALRVARDAPRLSIALIGSVYIATLLYTLFMIGIAAQAAISAIPLQVLLIASTIFSLTRSQLPHDLRRFGLIALAAQAIILVTTLFPPVTRPWWVPVERQTNAPLPRLAFIFDGRFDGSMHFPTFAVDRAELILEWTAIVAVAICLGLLTRVRRR